MQALSFPNCKLESECKLHPRNTVKVIFMEANTVFVFPPLSLLSLFRILSPSISFSI